MAKLKKSRKAKEAGWGTPIVLTAGDLQHALRIRGAPITEQIIHPLGDSRNVLSLLEIFPPRVWKGNETYRVGGLRAVCRALLRFLAPETEVQCLEFQHPVPSISTCQVAMLSRRLVGEAEFQAWLADPTNWQLWFIEALNARSFGRFFSVKETKGGELLTAARRYRRGESVLDNEGPTESPDQTSAPLEEGVTICEPMDAKEAQV